ncbi:hypothetical protein A3C87_01145 [Candidatus Kaiserbacteria bacterium RIFCSPHIGHO2_02_FULL_49_34]|uniref:Peptidase M14 domain-containing protein n=1 Tax=Candidatus Kaiserbacteria bacterium RIFCSPHIGHO2_02_FULL_49_34 TaxID=1798491 RepID=A0A1F6DL75_9BACT|nr:MAG: hypothetical protein A3C87_01145 [Candidatus Kaiserbacteria bacterium RIFCSPHIGHO2_02_FULL_49_34]
MHRKRVGIVAFSLMMLALIFALSIQKSTPEQAPVPEEPVGVEEEEVVEADVPQVIGYSVEGRAIPVYHYGSMGAQSAGTHTPRRFLFVGGVHGGYEWNSVVLAYEAMDYFEAHPEVIPEGTSVAVIPNLNPDAVYKTFQKEGRVTLADRAALPADTDFAAARFNANNVDLNRNFACKWQPESSWRGKKVSAGTEAFSEPEAAALRNFVAEFKPHAAIFWHSQASAVYASECEEGVLPKTLSLMNIYGNAAKYKTVDSFDAYPVTGDVEGWLASINIPAITVELTTHEDVEWERNLSGIQAVLKQF